MLKIKNVSLFLCIICFFYMIFEIIMNTQLTKLSVYYDIFRLIFFVPISYYFFRNIKFKKYFKVKQKMSFIEIIYFWALISVSILLINFFTRILGINIISKVSSIIINDNHWKILIIIDIMINTIIRPFLEEIVFRGVIMNDLKKYSYKVAIVINSILFGLMHYNINNTGQYIVLGIIFSYIAYKYSLKYSILLHILCNIPSVMSIIFYINRDSYSTEALLSYSGLLVIILFLFLILGLIRKKYKEIFSIFKLNNEDRKNIAEFVKNNGLYLFVILVIVISNLLFNYKLF